jgi:ribose 5-phosphate isomerase B
MKIFLAADHAGFEHKEILKRHLKQMGYKVSDEGAFSLEPADDYPDFMHMAVLRLAGEEPGQARAILLGGSGQGEAMVANRYKGVRAVVYYGGSKEILTLARTHNNANVLALGSRFLATEEIIEAVDLWLNTDFSGEDRHIRRIVKIDNPQEELEF